MTVFWILYVIVLIVIAGMFSRLQGSERSYPMVADAQIERAARVRK